MKYTFATLAIILITAQAAQDFSSPAYQAQSRSNKLQQLWTNVVADTSSGSFPSALDQAKLFLESMKVSMEYVSDVFPDGRLKLIHSVGNVAQVQFVAQPDTPYTGLFKGADSALIRLSVAKQPDQTKTTAAEAMDNFTPGFGLKMLRDGVPSANLVAMFGVNGIPSWNFFAKDFSNHIPGASGLALTAVAQKFSSATDFIQTVGLKEFAAYDQNGKQEQSPSFPWRLIFRAPDQVKGLFTDDFQDSFQNQLASLPAGQTLYDVYAIDHPQEACEKKIGSLVLKTKLTSSKFGDQQLFFQHQKMDNDLAVHPEWADYTPKWVLIGNRDAKLPEGKCPFASLFA